MIAEKKAKVNILRLIYKHFLSFTRLLCVFCLYFGEVAPLLAIFLEPVSSEIVFVLLDTTGQH